MELVGVVASLKVKSSLPSRVVVGQGVRARVVCILFLLSVFRRKVKGPSLRSSHPYFGWGRGIGVLGLIDLIRIS